MVSEPGETPVAISPKDRHADVDLDQIRAPIYCELGATVGPIRFDV